MAEKANVSRSEATSEAIDEDCPECGKPLRLKLGRYGRFISCSGYPDCNYARPIDGPREAPEPVGRDCPDCGKPLVYRQGRYGRFISCSGYPGCKYLESLNAAKSTGVGCPQCGSGELVEKRSRYGKIFYSCNTYPKCKYAVWGEPVAHACPRCAWPVLYRKSTKRRGEELVCPQADCAFHFPEQAETAEIEELLNSYQPPEAKAADEVAKTPAKKPARGKKPPAATKKSAPAKSPARARATRKKSSPAKV